MQGLELLLNRQHELEERYKVFLATLAPKTVTLAQWVNQPEESSKVLGLPWFDSGIFKRRLSAAADYLLALPSHPRLRGLPGLSLLFFQAASTARDQAEIKRRRKQLGNFFDEVSHCAPVVAYVNSGTNFVPFLCEGRIPPLMQFSGNGFETQLPIVGHQIIDISKQLHLSPAIATEYLARRIIHDLGHSFLPLVAGRETLHNAVMLVASAGYIARRASSSWEKLILRESTDPYFFLTARRHFEACTDLDPVQAFIMKCMRRWYVGHRCEKKRENIWGISPGMSPVRARRRVRAVINEMKTNGFANYDDRYFSEAPSLMDSG